MIDRYNKNTIASFYFVINNKNYDQRAFKNSSEFYSSDIDQVVLKAEVKLWHTNLETISVHGILPLLVSAIMTYFQLSINSSKFLRYNMLNLMNTKYIFYIKIK